MAAMSDETTWTAAERDARDAVTRTQQAFYRVLRDYPEISPQMDPAVAATARAAEAALDALMAASRRAGVAELPCYRVNWQRPTLELDCGALLRVRQTTNQPFRAVTLCPSCKAKSDATVRE